MVAKNRSLYKRKYPELDSLRLVSGNGVDRKIVISEFLFVAPHLFIPPDVLARDEACLKRRHAGYSYMTPFEATDLFAQEYVKAFRWQSDHYRKLKKGRSTKSTAQPAWIEWWQSPDAAQIWRTRQEFDTRGLPYGHQRLRVDTGDLVQAPMMRLMRYYAEDCHQKHLPLANQLCAFQGPDAYEAGINRRNDWKRKNDREDDIFDGSYSRENWDGNAGWRDFLDNVADELRLFGLIKRTPATDNGLLHAWRLAEEGMAPVLVAEFGSTDPYNNFESARRREQNAKDSRARRERNKEIGKMSDTTSTERSRRFRAAKKDDPAYVERNREQARVGMQKSRAIGKIKKALPDDAVTLAAMLAAALTDGVPENDWNRIAIARKIDDLKKAAETAERELRAREREAAEAMALEASRKAQEAQVAAEAAQIAVRHDHEPTSFPDAPAQVERQDDAEAVEQMLAELLKIAA